MAMCSSYFLTKYPNQIQQKVSQVKVEFLLNQGYSEYHLSALKRESFAQSTTLQ